GDAVVLDDGDALLADVDRDEELALRRRERRPASRNAAALRRALRALLLALRALLLLRLRLLRPLGRRFLLGRLGCRRGPLAAAPAAAIPATALGLGRGGAVRHDGLGARCFLRRSGRLDGHRGC